MRQPFRVVTLNALGPAMRRTFVMLCLGTAIMFVFTGMITMIQVERQVNPASDLRKWMSTFTVETLLSVMGQEVPYLSTSVQASESVSLSNLAFQLLTSVNPEDPRTFLGRELPGFDQFNGDFLVKGDGVDYTDAPIESPPPPPNMELPELKEEVAEKKETDEEEKSKTDAPKQTTDGKKRVFIYHTHWNESFLPVLKTDNPNLAFNPDKNITDVGKKFAKELEKLGIGATISDKSYTRQHAYEQSRETVKAAMANSKDLQYFFDLHRDSQRQEKTTVKIDGKTHARVMFVIGEENKNYKENYELADKFHNKLQEMYPGLSRGIFPLKGEGVNGVYNQNLSPRVLLIEVGGVDNTFEELDRTATALANAFTEIYWEAKAVDASSE